MLNLLRTCVQFPLLDLIRINKYTLMESINKRANISKHVNLNEHLNLHNNRIEFKRLIKRKQHHETLNDMYFGWMLHFGDEPNIQYV